MIAPEMNEMSPIPSITVTKPGIEIDASTPPDPATEKVNSKDCAPVLEGSAGHMVMPQLATTCTKLSTTYTNSQMMVEKVKARAAPR